MEDPNSTLLPYILETLSRKPELSDTFEHLCKDIEEQLAKEHNGQRFGNVRNSLQRAVNVGQNLGILTLTNEVVRVPFNFRVKAGKAPPIAANSGTGHLQAQPPIGTGNNNTHQRTGFVQRITRPPTQQKRVAPNYGGVAGGGGGACVGGDASSDITVSPIPAPLPMPIRRPRIHRMTRSRAPMRNRGRSRSTIRRRNNGRRRPLRGRSRSGNWRRRR